MPDTTLEAASWWEASNQAATWASAIAGPGDNVSIPSVTSMILGCHRYAGPPGADSYDVHQNFVRWDTSGIPVGLVTRCKLRFWVDALFGVIGGGVHPTDVIEIAALSFAEPGDASMFIPATDLDAGDVIATFSLADIDEGEYAEVDLPPETVVPGGDTWLTLWPQRQRTGPALDHYGEYVVSTTPSGMLDPTWELVMDPMDGWHVGDVAI